MTQTPDVPRPGSGQEALSDGDLPAPYPDDPQ